MKLSFSKMTFVKLPRHKRFDFAPRYYDEQKERMEERKKQIREELERKNNESYQSPRSINFRANIEQSYDEVARTRKSTMANIRMLFVLGVILFLCYMIFTNIESILSSVLK